MLTIKIASSKDFHLVRDFYHHLIDELKDKPHKPKWAKGIYPSDDYLKEALDQKELFVGSLDDRFCAAMVVNQKNQKRKLPLSMPWEFYQSIVKKDWAIKWLRKSSDEPKYDS